VVVELGRRRDAYARPHGRQPRGQQVRAGCLEDLVRCLVRAHIDEVQGVEFDPAVEMTGPHHVDLVGGAHLRRRPVRVRHALGHVAGLAPPWLGEPGPGDLPLEGPPVRDRIHAHAAELPRHRRRPVLGPGIGLQAQPGVQDQPAQSLGRAPRGAMWGSRAAFGPRLVACLLLGSGDPLAHPPVERRRAAAVSSVLSPPRRRRTASLRSSSSDNATSSLVRARKLTRNGTMSCGQGLCAAGTMSCGSRRNDVLRAVS
jgi:hypothetical protein